MTTSFSEEPFASLFAGSSDRVELRLPVDADLSALLAMRNNVTLQKKLMAQPCPNTIDTVREWLQRRLSEETSVFFVIADKSTQACVGYLQLLDIHSLHRRGVLGICVDDAHQGCGYGREALRLLEIYAITALHLQKITLSVLANSVAVGFYQRLGYETIGTHRQHFYQDGQFLDVTLMEKLLSV